MFLPKGWDKKLFIEPDLERARELLKSAAAGCDCIHPKKCEHDTKSLVVSITATAVRVQGTNKAPVFYTDQESASQRPFYGNPKAYKSQLAKVPTDPLKVVSSVPSSLALFELGRAMIEGRMGFSELDSSLNPMSFLEEAALQGHPFAQFDIALEEMRRGLLEEITGAARSKDSRVILLKGSE